MFDLKYSPYELLYQKVQPFDFDQHDPEQIEQEMIKIMQLHRGVGLAANQIGLDARVFVAGSNDISGFVEPQAFFNPVILRTSTDIQSDKEGCLSYPGLWLKVKRPVWIEAAYQNAKGETIEVRVDGYLAKVFQHEHDHLEGICFVNRVSKLSLNMAAKKLAKQIKRKN